MIRTIGIGVGIVLLIPLHSTTIEAGCENCGCCKDGVCGSGFAEGRQIMSDFCKHGCIPGYGGNKCYNKCPSYCLTCNHTKPQICESCADGKYLSTTDRRECLNCSFKCKKCTSLTKCQECSSPYFNDEITTDCSLTCPRNCLCEIVGTCSSCAQGYYNITNQCRDVCPSTCSHCTDKSHCLSCQPSYSGDMCCVKGEYCKKCSSSTVCDKCIDGYYGQMCNKPCPGACQKTTLETQCEKVNGTCLSCGVGLYGDYCTFNCSERCQNNRCHKDTGHCTDGCVDGFQGQNCTEEDTSELIGPISSSAGAAVGGVVGVVVIIGIVVIIFVVYRRRSQPRSHKNLKEDNEQNVPKMPAHSIKREKTRKTTEAAKNDDLEEDLENVNQDLVQTVTERQDLVYENIPSMNISRLAAYVRAKTKETYELEFGRLPRGLVHSYNDSQKPENVVMNRYNGLYPYDHSRVKINKYPDFFINACYIDGFQNPNAYIASLGPIAKATRQYYTFWKMVWYKKSDIIVMLTNLIEPSGNKCEQYWPNLNCSNTHQDITVSCQSIQVFTEYTLRTFTIEKKSEQRVIYQLHYTAWPDKSIPEETVSLVEFRQRVRSISRVQHGPVIVHCSAGIGRTGTYIALDRLTETGEAGERINVYDCVYQMRQQRVNMVQTLEQYEFLHKALVHTLTFGGTAVRADEFGEYVRNTSDAEFKKKFDLLKNVIDEQSPEEIQARAKNGRHKDKNRKDSDIPGDKHRPMLHICRSINSSNYINAMYVNGFGKKNQYIIAQSPLPETVVDFLCLVYQESCSCIVSMEDAELFGKGIGAYFRVDSHELKRGSFVVKASGSESKQNYSTRKLTITNTDKHSSGERVVHHYHFNKWKSNQMVPSDAIEFTQFVKHVTDKAEEINNEKAPILVHCLNGAERSGLFCAVSLLLEKVEGEGQISVPNVLRQLRNRRRKAIPNKEQFEFCFRCVEAHLDSSNTYTNIASFNLVA